MVVIFLLFVAWVSCSSQCSGINAQVNCQFSDHDTNDYINIASFDGSDVVVLEKYNKYNDKKWKVEDTGTVVQTMKMEYASMDTVLRDTIVDQDGIDDYTTALTSMHHLSNLQRLYIHVDYQPPYAEDWTIGTLGCEDMLNLEWVHFTIFNKSARDLSFSSTVDYKGFVPRSPYSYPTPQKPFYTYLKNGSAAYPEDPNYATSVRTLKSNTLTPQVKTYIHRTPQGEWNTAYFCAVVFTQGSVKLVQYKWEFAMNLQGPDFGTAIVQDAMLLVPNIIDSSFKPEEQYSTYIKFDEQFNTLFVLLELNRDQAAAFDTQHPGMNVLSQFPTGKPGPYPFVVRIRFDVTKKAYKMTMDKAVLVLGGLGKDPKGWPDQAYGTGLDVRAGNVVVTSSTYLYKTFDGSQQSVKTIKSYVSLLQNEKFDSPFTSHVLDGYAKDDDFPGVKSSERTFFPSGCSWTVDGLLTRVYVGGMVYSYSNPYNKKGRMYLIDVTDPKAMTIKENVPMGFSDRDSNMVNFIEIVPFTADTKKKGDDDYRMFVSLMLDGPKDDAKDDVTYQADIWRIDCTTPSKGLDIFAKVVFYLFFALAVIMFCFSTCIFSLKAFYKCGRRIYRKINEMQDADKGEQKNLLDEGEADQPDFVQVVGETSDF